LIKKSVLITGAGRGLGKAVANAYHACGFQVIVTDFDPRLLDDYSGKKGYFPLQMDVSVETEVEKCARQTEQLFGKLDLLISNAGVMDFYPVSEAGAEKLKKIFDVNVFGLANLTKYFLPLLVKSQGRLIVISSESFKVPSPFQPYSVSKQALEKLYGSIRLEFMAKGIKTILIRPGAIQTLIMEKTFHLKGLENESVFKDEFDHFRLSIVKYIRKISTPEQVSKIILKAGTAKRPRRIYNINHNLLVTLLSHLPGKLKEKLIIKSLKG